MFWRPFRSVTISFGERFVRRLHRLATVSFGDHIGDNFFWRPFHWHHIERSY